MSGARVWGIYRERTHSPGREGDDEAILDAVAAKVASAGLGEVRTLDPHELPDRDPAPLPDLIFYMCEEYDVLARLAGWQERGVALINPVQGARNTLRTETVRLLEGTPFFPASRFLGTGEPAPAVDGRRWVKRGDYHAVCDEDVVHVDSTEALGRALAQFRERGVPRVVVQDHVEGDLIKFYGVREDATDRQGWFKWFYHKDQTLAHHPVDEPHLRQTCMHGARLLGLEVFGGDVIVSPRGEFFAIDFNAWPSFALFRDEAADHIAALLASRCPGGARDLDAPCPEKIANR